MDRRLRTDRLILRPFVPADAGAVQAFCADWDVARMTSRIPHPYPEGAAAAWIASNAEAAGRGEEYVFCVERDGEVLGAAGLRAAGDGRWELGYWLGKPWWGQGYATEAAARLLRFAFEELGARRATAGHLPDNPASGRVLEKCGFAYTEQKQDWCAARGQEVTVRRMELAGRDRHETGTTS